VKRKRLFLIDGMSHIYRAYYAIRNLSNSKGMPTNAVFGFTSMLRKLIEDQAPDYLGVAFDLEGPTVRHEKYGGYKAKRKPMPPDLIQQIPYIRKVCEAFRVPVIGHEGYEADDVIGTLSRKAAERGLEIYIVTSDKDMLQLVSENVYVLDAMKDNLILDSSKVEERLGVRPDQVVDLLGLWGDASDNIPGAPGIGEKGAKELIREFGSIDALLDDPGRVSKKSQRESLRNNAEIIRMSRELATIQKDLAIDLDLPSLELSEPDRQSAYTLFSELEFHSLKQEFFSGKERPPVKAVWYSGAEHGGCMEKWKAGSSLFVALAYSKAPMGRKAARFGSAYDGSGNAILFDLGSKDDLEAWRGLADVPDLKKVAWDSKLWMLSQKHVGQRDPEIPHDGMLMAFLTSPNEGEYSLKRWAMNQLDVSLDEDYVEDEGFLPPDRDRVAERLCLRVESLCRLYDILEKRLEGQELRRVYEEIELPLVPVLADMEQSGIRVDRDILKKMSSEMEQQLQGLTGKIYEAAGEEFNINSPKQLGTVLFEKMNLPVKRKTRKTGSYSTDQSVLEELAQTYELPSLILEFRQIAKLKSTYVDALPALIHPETGRVHTSFHQTGAATGRLSSSDPNLQNIPIRTDAGRLIRSAFVSDKGKVLVSADYSQVELRVLAHLSGDEVLVKAFRAGEDIHDRTAREVFGEGELENAAECRRRAKVINFGIIYGLSAFGLSQTLGISREDAQKFIDAYFRRYQGVRTWLDRTLEEVRSSGIVRTLFGRMRPIPDIQSKDYNARQFAERTAVNSPIQGTAADIIKIAMIRIHRLLLKEKMLTRILLQVHDELILEVPEDEIDAAMNIVREEMEGAASLEVPLVVDIKTARNWMEAK
jgi:DNA polymerase-1